MIRLQIAPGWREEIGCLASRTLEPVLCCLCPWHSEPRVVKWGMGMHRELLCGHSAFGSEEQAGPTLLPQNTRGKDRWQSWAWLVMGVGL